MIRWQEKDCLKSTLRWVLKKVGVNTKKPSVGEVGGELPKDQPVSVLIGEKTV